MTKLPDTPESQRQPTPALALAQGSAARPTPTKADYELARNIVWRVYNLPFATYGEADDAIAQVLANARAGYPEPIPPPSFSKPNVQDEPRDK